MLGQPFTVDVDCNGDNVEAKIDSGATRSASSNLCVAERAIEKSEVVPIRAGNGDTIFSDGMAVLTLNFGGTPLCQKALVVQTDAFQAVLGTDFLTNPRVGGILTQPPPVRLLIDGKTINLENTTPTSQKMHRIFRLFKKESYTLIKELRLSALAKLDVSVTQICFDMFANHKMCQEGLYCTRQNSAWRYDWSKLRLFDSEFLWANPPFSQLDKVLTKLALEPTRLILVSPDWSSVYWSRLLEKLAVAQVLIEKGIPLYQGDWHPKPLLSTRRNTLDRKIIK